MNIDDSQIQMTLDLDSTLLSHHRSVKDVLAAGIYRHGLKRTAAELDQSPGNLSVMLSGDGQRHFDVDLLELYVQKTGDLAPIHYLVAKYCGDRAAVHDDALEKIQQVLSELPTLLASAGMAKRIKR
jgi:hypothetical protein